MMQAVAIATNQDGTDMDSENQAGIALGASCWLELTMPDGATLTVKGEMPSTIICMGTGEMAQ